MKTICTLLFCLFIVFQATAQPLQQVAPELLGMNSKQLWKAGEAVQRAVDEKQIPGAVLAVVHKGKLAYLKAYGNKQVYPDILPMDVNTVFDLASVTKSVSTAISAMVLIEQGKLRFADKVSDFIPEFSPWTDEEGNTKVDIRVIDLLTHTSGLPSYASVKVLKEKYGTTSPDVMIDHIATVKRHFRPKTGFQYSCLNYITLQKIIETVSGQSLRDFAKENIYDVLGMYNTDYMPSGDMLANCAPTEKQPDGSVLKGVVHDPLAREMMNGVSGNAGLFSDANDLAVLAAALLNKGEYNGKRVLSPLGVQTMSKVPRNISHLGRTPGWDTYSPYSSNNGDLLGPNTYGHTGYTGTSIILDPDNDIAVILLTNRAHPDDQGEAGRLRSLVANAVAASVGTAPERTYTPHYYKRVESFNDELPIGNKDIVFLGNSLTEGGDWSKMFNKKNIRNRGIVGDEALGIYDRLYQILPGKPAKIFFMIGVNDISHDLTTDTIVNRITSVIQKIRTESPKTKLYVQSLLPFDESVGRYKRLNGKTGMVPEINVRLKQIAADNGCIFLDLFPQFVRPGTNVLRKELATDGLHLNQEGYRIWSEAIRKYVK